MVEQHYLFVNLNFYNLKEKRDWKIRKKEESNGIKIVKIVERERERERERDFMEGLLYDTTGSPIK